MTIYTALRRPATVDTQPMPRVPDSPPLLLPVIRPAIPAAAVPAPVGPGRHRPAPGRTRWIRPAGWTPRHRRGWWQ